MANIGTAENKFWVPVDSIVKETSELRASWEAKQAQAAQAPSQAQKDQAKAKLEQESKAREKFLDDTYMNKHYKVKGKTAKIHGSQQHDNGKWFLVVEYTDGSGKAAVWENQLGERVKTTTELHNEKIQQQLAVLHGQREENIG